MNIINFDSDLYLFFNFHSIFIIFYLDHKLTARKVYLMKGKQSEIPFSTIKFWFEKFSCFPFWSESQTSFIQPISFQPHLLPQRDNQYSDTRRYQQICSGIAITFLTMLFSARAAVFVWNQRGYVFILLIIIVQCLCCWLPRPCPGCFPGTRSPSPGCLPSTSLLVWHLG